MVYHRFIENIKDLRIMFDGKLTTELIMKWKYGQIEYWIEKADHPYHNMFFSKPKLVEKWKRRINDKKNQEEIHYRDFCRSQKRFFLS